MYEPVAIRGCPGPGASAIGTVRRWGVRAAGASLLALLATPAGAQIQRHPTGVNVNASGATTVFVTFGNLQGKVPVEATWCGSIVPAAPGIGFRCDPATIFGNLPIRLDRSRISGQDGFTDIMSIPPSVARRAYQAAQAGEASEFYYVRRFVDPGGFAPDEYVTVTCRLTGGGARTPFALTDVRIEFDTKDPVLPLRAGDLPPPLRATIAYNGTGRLRGRWEIVFPGEEPPTSQDLLTEATLPVELRGTQRRFTELSRFNIFLPPTGEVVLPGPDPDALPTHIDGLYLVLLRVEATADKEGDSDLGAAGAGAGVAHSGAVAGFPLPPLRYYVGGGSGIGTRASTLELLFPDEDAVIRAADPIIFSWEEAGSAVLYRLEVEDARQPVLSALLQPGVGAYQAPPWLVDRLHESSFRWRVVSLDPSGRSIETTGWRGGSIARDEGAAAGEQP